MRAPVPDLQANDHRPENPELFISYASGDIDRAAALYARLTALGFCVWFDNARLTPGCDWHREIEAGCEAARLMLPLLTPRWAKSEWTRYETYVHNAVIPVLAEGKRTDVMPPPLRRWDALTLDPLMADEAAWQKLISAIRSKLAEPAPERAPRIVDLPYPANPFFTGRGDDLVQIHAELHAAPVAALIQGRVRALAAMGGIGKTTLANEYARRYWRLYRQILWVDARLGLESGFALLFGKLFPGRSDAGMQQPDKAKLVLAELSDRTERLLVLDNVEDAESVRPWLQRDPTSGCRTLITSRFAEWPAAAGIRTIPLDVLEPEAAQHFLLTGTGRTAEGAEEVACDALARELGYLPLALEQAAAYIAAPGAGVNFAGYLRLYREATAELLARGALGSTEYPDSVVTTWRTTVSKLSPESRGVLQLCAWYADTAIPRVLVMAGAKEVLALAAPFSPMAPLSGPGAAELRMRDALTGLARYSMILNATDTIFRVHGLVQTVERMQAEADCTAAEARDRALTRLVDIFPHSYNNPAQWQLCRLLLPHQHVLLANTFPEIATERRATLLDRAGSFLNGSGDAAAALPLLTQAADALERALGPEHFETLASVNNLAVCLQALGDAGSALPLCRRVLEGHERLLGPDHPDTALCLNNLANMLQDQGDLAEARQLSERALAILETTLGPTHPGTGNVLRTLANVLRAQGDFAAAQQPAERALAIFEATLGAFRPETANSLNILASVLQAQGDLPGARVLNERALAICETALGPTHPDTATSLNTLAYVLQAQGDLAGARPLRERALAIRKAVLGPEHPDTATSFGTLAGLLQAEGDLAGARLLYERALAIYEAVYGLEHPQMAAAILNDLGTLLQDQGDLAGAQALHERALAIRETALGLDHPDTATSLNNLAGLLRSRGDLARARAHYERTLTIFERTRGSNDPDMPLILSNLAMLLQDQGDFAGARSLLKRGLAICEAFLGQDHPNTALVLSNLARLLRDQGDLAGAQSLLERALKTGETVLGSQHPLTKGFISHLARVFLDKRCPAEAISLGKRALGGHETVLGATHAWTKDSARVTADALDVLGNREDAYAVRSRYGLV
jgi:tetratricopeptide (TPR) repeat protein